MKIATRKYTLACTIEEGKLIVKTVMQITKDFWEKFNRKATNMRFTWRLQPEGPSRPYMP